MSSLKSASRALFYRDAVKTSFTDVAIDVDALYRDHPIGAQAGPGAGEARGAAFQRLYRSALLPLRYRRMLWQLAHRSNLDQLWFEQFNAYWSQVLGARPLWCPHDFFFLKNLYRQRFQRNQVPDGHGAHTHLEAWQRPELVYHLLHMVAKEAIGTQLGLIEPVLRHGRPRTIVEFGCGTAPIAATLCEFFNTDRMTIQICDLKTVPFHFAAHRFRHRRNVRPLLVRPENDFLPPVADEVDAIFCITVFEHLTRPLDVARAFHRWLRPGGLLCFDYIKSDGEGLDTRQGVLQREEVLDFFEERFVLRGGRVDRQRSLGPVIARKR